MEAALVKSVVAETGNELNEAKFVGVKLAFQFENFDWVIYEKTPTVNKDEMIATTATDRYNFNLLFFMLNKI
jgi:hypothetical protein